MRFSFEKQSISKNEENMRSSIHSEISFKEDKDFQTGIWDSGSKEFASLPKIEEDAKPQINNKESLLFGNSVIKSQINESKEIRVDQSLQIKKESSQNNFSQTLNKDLILHNGIFYFRNKIYFFIDYFKNNKNKKKKETQMFPRPTQIKNLNLFK